jgi:hypothetical protein
MSSRQQDLPDTTLHGNRVNQDLAPVLLLKNSGNDHKALF